MAGWQSGYAAACKAVYAGSIPASASNSGFNPEFIRFMKFFFTSFFFFVKRIFISIEVDFIFSYHKSFASKDGKLPELIKPLISYCKKYNYSYLIFEETDIASQKKFIFQDKAVPLIFISLIESLLRKVFIWTSSENFTQDWRQGINRGKLDQKVSKISSFFVSKIECKKIITLVSHKSNFWFYGFPAADIYDLQHGIIFDGDINYLLNGLPPDFKVKTGMKTLVHSDLFKNLLINGDSSNFYNEQNVRNIGRHQDVVKFSAPKNENISNLNYILFSAQNALDCDQEEREIYMKKTTNFFKIIEPILKENNLKILHRDHPRADLSIPIPYLDFDYISRSNNSTLTDDFQNPIFHMTFNSSSAIEAASYGLPTIFLELDKPTSGDFPDLAAKDIFFRQYEYPLIKCLVSSVQEFEIAIEEILSKSSAIHQTILDWHQKLATKMTDDLIFDALDINNKTIDTLENGQ